MATENPKLAERLPKIWIGFALTVFSFFVLMAEVAVNPYQLDIPFAVYYLVPLIAAWFYWLFCVYRFHDILESIPGYRHPISAAKAFAMHFIPVYNLYWVFKWSSGIASFVNWRTQSQTMSGALAGGLVLLSFLVSRVEGFLGLILLFGSAHYISRRMRQAFAAPPVPASAMAPPEWRGPLGL